MPTHEQAEPGDTDEPVTLPIGCPPLPTWDAVPEAVGEVGEPRTLYAAMILAGALGGAGLSGLKALCRRDDGRLELSAAGRDGVTAAFVAADELLKQAWDEPPAARGVGNG